MIPRLRFTFRCNVACVLNLICNCIQWRIQGGKIRPLTPPSKLAMEFGPLRGRKSNGSIVILSKSKDFPPPVSMSATDLAPYGKKYHIKHEKGR